MTDQHLDAGRERIEAGDRSIRRILQLLDAQVSPTGGWLVSPAGLRDLVAERLSIRIAFRAGLRREHGPLLNVQPNSVTPGQWWGTCPWCARAGLLDQDQLEGRVSVECNCGYHETHDHRQAR